MRLAPLPALLALGLAAAGCGGGGAGDAGPATTARTPAPTATVGPIETPAPEDALEIGLVSPEGPTAVGTAYLWPAGEEQTNVLVVVPTRTGAERPVAIREGTCEEFDRHPPFTLENLRGGVSESVVDLPTEELGEEPHSLVVLTGFESPEVHACGTIVVEP